MRGIEKLKDRKIELTQGKHYEGVKREARIPYIDGEIEEITRWYYDNEDLLREASHENRKVEWYVRYRGNNEKFEFLYEGNEKSGTLKYQEYEKLLAIIVYENSKPIFGKWSNGKVLTDEELRRIHEIAHP